MNWKIKKNVLTRRINIIMLIMLLIESTVGRPTKPKRRKSCGRALADRIQYVCENLGGYNPYTVARPLNSSQTRFRRGIVEECCKSSCSDTELYPYCKIQKVDGYNESSSSIADASSQEVKEHKSEAVEKKIEPVVLTEKPTVFVNNERRKFIPFEIGTMPPEFSKPPISPSRTRMIYAFS